jgi:hypothetical protein
VQGMWKNGTSSQMHENVGLSSQSHTHEVGGGCETCPVGGQDGPGREGVHMNDAHVDVHNPIFEALQEVNTR